MQANPIGVIILSGLFIAIGVGFAALGRAMIASAGRLTRVGVRVPGELIGFHTSESSDIGRSTYYPVLRFATVDGRSMEAQSDIGTDPPSGHEGDRITVVYDPADPRRARIDSMLGRGSAIGWACLIGGCALALVSAALGIAGLL